MKVTPQNVYDLADSLNKALLQLTREGFRVDIQILDYTDLDGRVGLVVAEVLLPIKRGES
jgi:hypothetical protein